jgi:hypothetical protein
MIRRTVRSATKSIAWAAVARTTRPRDVWVWDTHGPKVDVALEDTIVSVVIRPCPSGTIETLPSWWWMVTTPILFNFMALGLIVLWKPKKENRKPEIAARELKPDAQSA